jgi:hypothetical protein
MCDGHHSRPVPAREYLIREISIGMPIPASREGEPILRADLEAFLLGGERGCLMAPDEHRAAAALLRADGEAAVLAALHSVLAEALQLRVDEQCRPRRHSETLPTKFTTTRCTLTQLKKPASGGEALASLRRI